LSSSAYVGWCIVRICMVWVAKNMYHKPCHFQGIIFSWWETWYLSFCMAFAHCTWIKWLVMLEYIYIYISTFTLPVRSHLYKYWFKCCECLLIHEFCCVIYNIKCLSACLLLSRLLTYCKQLQDMLEALLKMSWILQ